MNTSNKLHRNAGDELLIAGILKHVGKSGSLLVAGTKYRVADLIAILQGRIDASLEVATARAAWLALVDRERARVEETNDLVSSLRQCLAGTYGSSVEALADFGLARRKQAMRTSASKAAAAQKAKATRQAHRAPGDRPPEVATIAPASPSPSPSNGTTTTTTNTT